MRTFLGRSLNDTKIVFVSSTLPQRGLNGTQIRRIVVPVCLKKDWRLKES